MPRAAAFCVSLVLLSTLGTGCRADREKCANAVQRFAELVYWDRHNAIIAKLPPEQRDAARKQKLIDFNREMDEQLDMQISRCVSSGADEQVECINRAKTGAEAEKCASIAKGRDGGGGCCETSGRTPAGTAALAALAALVGVVLLRRRRRRC